MSVLTLMVVRDSMVWLIIPGNILLYFLPAWAIVATVRYFRKSAGPPTVVPPPSIDGDDKQG